MEQPLLILSVATIRLQVEQLGINGFERPELGKESRRVKLMLDQACRVFRGGSIKCLEDC